MLLAYLASCLQLALIGIHAPTVLMRSQELVQRFLAHDRASADVHDRQISALNQPVHGAQADAQVLRRSSGIKRGV
jgi:hypothetical protein